MFWPLQENIIGNDDLELLVTFIRETKRFTQFTKVREFEAAYSEWMGCKHSVFVNSGSSANLLMIYAAAERYGWKPGDEVIVPALTWPTTVTPVMQAGFTPVFVDANLHDFAFDYDQLAAKITPRTRAIFLVHILGFPANVARIKQIIGDRDIVLLEDTCETQGGTIDGVKVGNFGLGSSFSFYWGHHMTTVEGGMICTNDEEFYKLNILKRSHGLARELPEKYQAAIRQQHADIDFQFLFLTDGFNFRNTEFNAVLGLSQLPKLNGFIEMRNRSYRRFLDFCRRYPDDLITLERPGMSSFVLPFVLKDGTKKQPFQALIRESGIESRPLISGNLLQQPFLKKYYVPGQFDVADMLHRNAFYIGNNQFVNDERLDVLEQLMTGFFGN
ncbi:MAG: DegT/DnrJ/EryC1/StrS family aminotransferase [Prosthecobacter sp.]|uniref:DegT/DnrJ/EryC1/StrS family aminotransferase n=1 Tax=Prosthecobacter sp. TaxID=1965333 RepID=UPI0039027E8D